jgi:chlorinating enzyme
MPKLLTQTAVEQFQRNGFYFPIRVISLEEAGYYRQCLETYEARTGAPIQNKWRHKVHLLFTWANELIRHPKILDAVEDVLGPDIICWGTNFFIKEANDPAFVSWHQDSTYWGLEPPDIVTAWLALSDVSVASGAMKFIPGSHRWDQVAHIDTFNEKNLLTRGQEIAIDVDENEAVYIPLSAGEISLHHVRAAHGSAPNTTGDRRIGFAIRYIAPHVQQTKIRDSAMLVRGEDRYGYFDWEPEPVADLDEAALAAHEEATQRQIAALYSGTGRAEFRN